MEKSDIHSNKKDKKVTINFLRTKTTKNDKKKKLEGHRFVLLVEVLLQLIQVQVHVQVLLSLLFWLQQLMLLLLPARPAPALC